MDPIVPIISKLLERRDGGSVLDVGHGFGQHSLLLAERGFTVTALDVDADEVAKLNARAKERNLPLTASVGDVRSFTLAGAWDIVICTYVLHFLQDEEVGPAIENLKRHTKAGGLNIVAAHTIENGPEEHARKPHLFAPDELRERYADWEVLDYTEALSQPFVSKRTGGAPVQKYAAELIAQKPA